MTFTAVCTHRVKMFVRAIREVMVLADVPAMFFEYAICAHFSKFLAVITSSDLHSLLYEVRRSVEKIVNRKNLVYCFYCIFCRRKCSSNRSQKCLISLDKAGGFNVGNPLSKIVNDCFFCNFRGNTSHQN